MAACLTTDGSQPSESRLPKDASEAPQVWQGTALISVFALVFRHAPLLTSPVDGGGTATPSPPAGRVGVGAMFKSHCKDAYQSCGQSSQIAARAESPHSLPSPPLIRGDSSPAHSRTLAAQLVSLQACRAAPVPCWICGKEECDGSRLPARAVLGTRASRPPCQPREKKNYSSEEFTSPIGRAREIAGRTAVRPTPPPTLWEKGLG